MNRDLYSNEEFSNLRDRINKEILRRGTFKWWNPLTVPDVGEDRSTPLSLPDIGKRIQISDKTYTINTSSEGSIEPTRNIKYPNHGDNPTGYVPDGTSSNRPDTSAARFDVDEMKNFLVGLAMINDINLFYGRDEMNYTAFRDPKGIEDLLSSAENDKLNVPLDESPLPKTKNDPNGGIPDHRNPNYPIDDCPVPYPTENGKYVMPSGEYDGEETDQYGALSESNFYDDYGAKPGDDNFHPYNRYTSSIHRRDQTNGHGTKKDKKIIIQGGKNSIRFGTNPRNPQQGNEYLSVPVYGGSPGSCNSACTGLCYVSCDNECSEGCTTSCWSRCGNACTSTCGNVCTGCSTLCYTSCKTKCENSVGYACVKSGAKTVKITAAGGKNGAPARNEISITYHSCNGCSFSCQFYPNKKTECWDSGCMGKCFTSCASSCSTSCYGGCVDNDSESGSSYKTGKGKGCSSGCTLNCIGVCTGTCEGYCIQTCWHTCKQTCSDNCSWRCNTDCGSGCFQKCSQACTGCASCAGSCEGQSTGKGGCYGCGAETGCTSNCQHDCNKNCMGWGCRSICGIDGSTACEANCRMNCMNTSCTAMCSDACSSSCTSCVQTCGFQCGACSSECSTGCTMECNINCSKNCEQSCDLNCVMSCSETCGGCSNLCYSCVGMCIGVCSVSCEAGCSTSTHTCGYWCDSTCNRKCFGNCDLYCINSCSGSCISHLTSEANTTVGPEKDPTADGYIYPHPKNRWEERESFKLIRDIKPATRYKEPESKLITITLDEARNVLIIGPSTLIYDIKQSSIYGGVYSIDHTTGDVIINEKMLDAIINKSEPNLDGDGGVYIIWINNESVGVPFTDNDIGFKLPIGFEKIKIIDRKDVTIVIIKRDEFLFPEEEVNGEDK